MRVPRKTSATCAHLGTVLISNQSSDCRGDETQNQLFAEYEREDRRSANRVSQARKFRGVGRQRRYSGTEAMACRRRSAAVLDRDDGQGSAAPAVRQSG